jgi:hypothetical protein
MATELHPMRPEQASRTLTFLFTDIEGSTRLWEQHQQAMKQALERHRFPSGRRHPAGHGRAPAEGTGPRGEGVGPTLNRTARIMSAGHGGQVLLSAAAAALVTDNRFARVRARQPQQQRGYDGAAELGARMPQLRAAIGLCRAQQRGGGEVARELLRKTYADFTEGFATPDLTEAAALLETPAA